MHIAERRKRAHALKKIRIKELQDKFDTIFATVCAVFEIGADEFYGKSTTDYMREARAACVLVLKQKYPWLPMRDIAYMIGVVPETAASLRRLGNKIRNGGLDDISGWRRKFYKVLWNCGVEREESWQ